MAQHPSLRSKEKSKQHRSVLKRFERVKELKAKEKWEEGDSVFGLPKLKILKFKLKKEKAAPAAAEGTEGAPVAAAEGTEGAAKDTKGTAKEAKGAAKETKGAAKEAAPKKDEKKKK